MEKLSVIVHSSVARLGLVVVLPQLLVNAGLVHQDLELAQLINILPEELVQQFQVHGGVSRQDEELSGVVVGLEPLLHGVATQHPGVDVPFSNHTVHLIYNFPLHHIYMFLRPSYSLAGIFIVTPFSTALPISSCLIRTPSPCSFSRSWLAYFALLSH